MYSGYLTHHGPGHDADQLSVTSRKADPPFPTVDEADELTVTSLVERNADPPYPTIVKPIRTDTGVLLEISLPAEAIERAKLEDGTVEIRLIAEPGR